MTENSYSFTDIHLPENKNLIHLLKKLSFITSLFILGVCGVISVGWIANIASLKSLFINNSPIPIVLVAAFIFSAVTLLLEEKLGPFHAVNKASKKSDELYFIASAFCAAVVILIGFLQIVDYFVRNNVGFDTIFNNNFGEAQSVLNVGICVFLIGLSLLAVRIKAYHRFHVAQFLALNALVISFVTILGNIYNRLLAFEYSHIVRLPLNAALIVFLISAAISFRWPARGFVGMFTTESVSSKFALSVLGFKTLIIYFLGIGVIVGSRFGLYNSYEALVIFAVLMMVLSLVMAWFNIKLLYRFELERFFMREELRIHNIDLKLGNEELSDKMEKLKEANEEYSNKLNFRDKYEDVIDDTD